MRISTFVFVATMLAAAQPAFAQDSEADWTGAYAGVHVGYSEAKSDSVVTLSGQWTTQGQPLNDFVTSNWNTRQSPDGAQFGAQLGYNYQTSSNLVLGVEADFTVMDSEESFSRTTAGFPTFPTLTYALTNSVDAKSAFSLRARAGIAAGRTLIYATGGWAWTRADVGAEVLSSQNYTKAGGLSETFDGFVVGGGIEHKFGRSISARIEYLYSDQGEVAYPTAYRAGSAFVTPAYNELVTQDLRTHQVRLGLNFHF